MSRQAWKIQTLLLLASISTVYLYSELFWTRPISSSTKVTEDHICQGTFLSTRRRRPLCSHSLPSPASCSPAMFRVVLGAPRRLLMEGRESRQLVLVVVFVALLLDNMLFTVVGTSGAFSAEDCICSGSQQAAGTLLDFINEQTC